MSPTVDAGFPLNFQNAAFWDARDAAPPVDETFQTLPFFKATKK